MRVNNSTPLSGTEIANSRVAASPVRSSETAKGAENIDEVALSPAGASTLSNRADRIAALKTLVSSSGYTPSSADVSKKLVSEALTRPS
jgi:anti-sigma28 factor (negative regulator of flagellin synthesis)